MHTKEIAAALTAAVLCLSAMTAPEPVIKPESVSAASISDIPQEYRTACDWIWANRIETEGSCKGWSTIYDQIIAGNGTVQYILIWQSYETLTLAQRQKLPQMLEDALNKWNDCLVGYDDWPVEHVNVKVIGYAVLATAVTSIPQFFPCCQSIHQKSTPVSSKLSRTTFS